MPTEEEQRWQIRTTTKPQKDRLKPTNGEKKTATTAAATAATAQNCMDKSNMK